MSVTALPSFDHTFTVNIEGTDTKQNFTGTFTYRRPNLRAKSEIAKMTARLNEDLKNLDEDVAFLHNVLATLRYSLSPHDNAGWWKNSDYGYNLFDVNVVIDIYKECRKFEDEWFNKVWGETPKEAEKK